MLNKSFDPRSRCIRKGYDGEEIKVEEVGKKIVKIAVCYSRASQPPKQRPTNDEKNNKKEKINKGL